MLIPIKIIAIIEKKITLTADLLRVITDRILGAGSFLRFSHLSRNISRYPVPKLLGAYVGQLPDHLLVVLEIVAKLFSMFFQEFLCHPFYISRFYVAHTNPIVEITASAMGT